MFLSAEAFAKINRELRVGGPRPDGYHEIHSRFASIDLADRLEVEGADDLELSCSVPALSDESNLVARAARALATRLHRKPAARIHLEKGIPIGAGLGGGSADAAVALLLLSRMWESRLEEAELLAIAAELGSDVPYFLIGGEVDVSGRGERLRPLPDRPPEELLLLIPPFSTSTREVYALFDRLEPLPSLPERLSVDGSIKFFGPNDLASSVLALRGEMEAYRRSARETAEECGITGSGSAIVLRGITTEAEGRLGARHPEATLQRVRTLDREEYRRRTTASGGSTWKSPR